MKNQSLNDCSICCEKLNNSTRKNVKCVFCDYSCCKTCFQKYLLETNNNHCMSCKKVFIFDFIDQHCSKTFINGDLKKHRENVLLDQQKALIPETQPYVEREKERKKIQKQIEEIENENHQLQNIIIKNKNRIRELWRNTYTVPQVQETEKKKFIRKCPIEDCRGFLSTHWKCGLCEKQICNKCNEEKEENHTCLPENVKTMELLNKDTKPCPKCATMIHKINGCDMMWCVECHTSFSWNRGVIETGHIHNPHYYEFLRKQNGNNPIPRNPGDNPCGNENNLPYTHLLRVVTFRLEELKFYSFHRLISHIENITLRRFDVPDQEVEFRELRIKYLLENIPDNEFKVLLQQKEKKKMKLIDIRDLYVMFNQTAIGKMHEIINKRVYDQEDSNYINNLVKYFNETSKAIGKKYGSVYPYIYCRNNDYNIISEKK